MPGTGLFRDLGPVVQKVGRLVERIPGVSSAQNSGPMLASVALDARWSAARSGALIVKDQLHAVKAFAVDPARESRLWEATVELLDVEG